MSTSTPDGPERRRGRGAVATTVGAVGEIMITLAVVLGLFIVYQVWWTDIASAKKQDSASAQLDKSFEDPTVAGNQRGYRLDAGEGVAFARLYIPSLGSDYQFAVVQGTSADDLEIGPGHYTNSQGPGEPGNFAIAGHRVGRGAPFNDLDAVKTCDAIVYETASTWFVYRVLPIDAPDAAAARAAEAGCMDPQLVDRLNSPQYAGVAGREIVSPADSSVIDPIPDSDAPADPTLVPFTTLTTCHPRFSANQRMIIHAALVRTQPRAGTPPPAELRG